MPGDIAVVGFSDNKTDDGFLVSFKIEDEGTIFPTALDKLEHETTSGRDLALMELDEDLGIFAMNYKGGFNAPTAKGSGPLPSTAAALSLRSF